MNPAVMGNNPSFFQGIRDWPQPGTDYGTDLNRPVESVYPPDAAAYCAAITARDLAAGRIAAGSAYRLPTEAEWEYACRAWTWDEWKRGEHLVASVVIVASEHGRDALGIFLRLCGE